MAGPSLRCLPLRRKQPQSHKKHINKSRKGRLLKEEREALGNALPESGILDANKENLEPLADRSEGRSRGLALEVLKLGDALLSPSGNPHCSNKSLADRSRQQKTTWRLGKKGPSYRSNFDAETGSRSDENEGPVSAIHTPKVNIHLRSSTSNLARTWAFVTDE
ncbi:hypothetical protein Mapa_013410 [Marchantia paleacea]|nr:hypothetical protein Mapa_013410 [Marchantia paleacea]